MNSYLLLYNKNKAHVIFSFFRSSPTRDKICFALPTGYAEITMNPLLNYYFYSIKKSIA